MLILFMQIQALAAVGSNPVLGATYRFIQLKNGQTIEAQAMPGPYRSTETVSRFASDVVTLGYTWDTSKRYIEDEGILFPDSFNLVSNAFMPDARLAWGRNFAQKYAIKKGGSQVLQNSQVLLTRNPKITQEKEGLWVADVGAIRFITNGGGKIYASERLHFQFAIQAINPQVEASWATANESLKPYAERFWADGLAVIDFSDLGGGV